MSSRMTFVLVHGASHGAWCWRRLQGLLTQAGHRVMVPDLPGLGNDPTPPGDVTFAAGVERVGEILARSSEPVVLVGHSLAGMYVSQVAEECPEKIRWLVYLTALLPRDGDSMMGLQTAVAQDQELLSCFVFEEKSVHLRLPEALPWFYHDCPEEEVQRAARLLKPQPLLPLQTPVTLSERFARVPRAYLACRDDRVLPLARQEAFFTATPCQQVRVLPCGHSPFLSIPTQLAAALEEVALATPESRPCADSLRLKLALPSDR